MNSRTTALDRFVTLVLGSLLVAAGLWVLAWITDLLPDGWWQPDRVVTRLQDGLADERWWPWALLALGFLLTLLGLAWLLQHLRHTAVDRLSLPGEPQGGRLVLGGAALATGAAHALEDSGVGVVSAKGALREADRAGLLLDLRAVVRPDSDLRAVGRACDVVAADVRRATGRADVACRIRLSVAKSLKPAARVH